MNLRMKTMISLATLKILSFSIAADAHAYTSELKPRTAKQVAACVAEIGRKADYEDAERVVHWVRSLDQESIVALHIDVETHVYAKGSTETIRKYKASCVTETTGDVVRIRIARMA